MPAGARATPDTTPDNERDARGRYLPKLSDEITEKVCQAIRSGSSLQAASWYAGVNPSALEGWLRHGRRGTGGPEHVAFTEAVEKAFGDWEVAAVGRLYQIGQEGDAKSLMFLLERKLPARWGARRMVEHAGRVDHVQHSYPMLDTSKLTDSELQTLIDLHNKARPDEHAVVDMPGPDRRALEA